MTIRDIHLVNSIEPDETVPIHGDGAEYLRESQSQFADLGRITRACTRAHHELPPLPINTANTSRPKPSSTDLPESPSNRPENTAQTSSAPLRGTVKGRRGAPPGRKVLPVIQEDEPSATDVISEDEVEQEVSSPTPKPLQLAAPPAGPQSISEGLALQRGGGPERKSRAEVYVLVPSSAVAKGTRAKKRLREAMAEEQPGGQGDGNDASGSPPPAKRRVTRRSARS